MTRHAPSSNTSAVRSFEGPVARPSPASRAHAENLPSRDARTEARAQRETLRERLPLARLRDVDAVGRGWRALEAGRAAATRSDTRLGRTARLGAASDRSGASRAAACRRATGARRAARTAAPGCRDTTPVVADVARAHVATGLRAICRRLTLRSRTAVAEATGTTATRGCSCAARSATRACTAAGGAAAVRARGTRSTVAASAARRRDERRESDQTQCEVSHHHFFRVASQVKPRSASIRTPDPSHCPLMQSHFTEPPPLDNTTTTTVADFEVKRLVPRTRIRDSSSRTVRRCNRP